MKYIDDPDKMQSEVIKRTFLLALIPIIYSLLSGAFSSLLSFIFGILIAILIFRLRLIHIRRSLDMDKGKAVTFIRNRYFIEYGIYFMVLIVARRNPSLNFLATAIGLFFIKFTVIGWMILDMIKESWEKKLDSYRK